MSFGSGWRAALRERFGDREVLSREAAYAKYWSGLGLSSKGVHEVLELFEREYSLPGGLLRPTDELTLFTTSVPTKNPLKWLVYQGRTEDRVSELNYELAERQPLGARRVTADKLTTLEDFVRAWLGQVPG